MASIYFRCTSRLVGFKTQVFGVFFLHINTCYSLTVHSVYLIFVFGGLPRVTLKAHTATYCCGLVRSNKVLNNTMPAKEITKQNKIKS